MQVCSSGSAVAVDSESTRGGRCARRRRLHAAGATQRRLHLQQRLAREDGQRLLEARNLLLARSLALAVRHRLRLALRLQLVKVGQDGVKLLGRRRLVLLVVAERNLQLLHLIGLALHVALLRRLGDGVLLGQLVGGGQRRILISLSLGQQRGEVALRHLQHRHDRRADVRARAAELRLLAAHLDESRRAVVLGQDVDRLRNRGCRILEVRRRLHVLLVLLLAVGSGLGLASIDLRNLGLKRLDVLQQLRIVGLRLLDARRRLVELAREVRLLRLRLTDLLIAERLLVRLLRGLLRELGNHVLDEAAHLAERIRPRARRQLHEREAVELLRQAAQHAHSLSPRVRRLLLLRERLHARRSLQEHLHALRQDLRRLRLRQRTLGGVELLLRRRARLGRLAQLLLRHRDRILKALLQHRVRVLSLHLVLAGAAQRLLSLLLHVRNRVEDARALGGVGRRRRLRLKRQVLIALAGLGLQQRLDHRLLVRVHPRRLHDLREPARDRRKHLRRLARLHEAKVLLQHRRGALQGVRRVNELLLRRSEVGVLLAADLSGRRQVSLRGGDLLRQLVDRARQGADRRLGILDRRLQVTDRALRARDGILLRVRLLVDRARQGADRR